MRPSCPSLDQTALGRFILFLLAAIWIGCDSGGVADDESDDQNSTAALSGVVRELGFESPIAAAEVSVAGAHETTGQDGRFELLNLEVGASVTIEVTAAGHHSYRDSMVIAAGVNIRDIWLERSETITRDEVILYLPPEVTDFTGLIWFLPGAGGDTIPFVRGLDVEGAPAAVVRDLRERTLDLLERHEMAWMGNIRFPLQQGTSRNRDMYLEILEVVEQIADESGHPELAQVPLLLIGYSEGGCHANAFNKLFSSRVVGVLTMKGGCHDQVVDEPALSTPAYLFIGEFDTESRANNLTNLFEFNRAQGAPWALAIEPGTEHGFVADNRLLINWMDAVLSHRLPETVTPGIEPALPPIDETSGWLGNRTTLSISEYACYDGDPLTASWFPDEQTAHDWQAMVSSGEVTTVITCGNGG